MYKVLLIVSVLFTSLLACNLDIKKWKCKDEIKGCKYKVWEKKKYIKKEDLLKSCKIRKEQ